MIRRRGWILVLAIAAAVAVVMAGRHGRVRPRNNVRHALGVTVRLKGLKRLPSGSVRAGIDIAVPTRLAGLSGLVIDDLSVESPDGFNMAGEYLESSETLGNQAISHVSREFTVPSGTEYLTLTQGFHIDRPSKCIHLKFRNVPVNTKPVTLSDKGCTVTLRAVYVNKPIDARRWKMRPTIPGTPLPKRFFAIEAREKCPAFTSVGLTYESFRDDRGRTALPETADELPFSSVSSAPTIPMPPPNVVESVVGVFNANKATDMRVKRYMNLIAATRGNPPIDELVLYCVPALNPPPKKFDLCLDFTLPPEPKDKAQVVFEEVPIGK